MTAEQLTAILAKRFMGWGIGPERFLLGDRHWIKRSHFEPLSRIEDAFRLLQVAAHGFSLTKTADGVFAVHVQVEDRTGKASGPVAAASITRAIARAIGMDLEDGQ